MTDDEILRMAMMKLVYHLRPYPLTIEDQEPIVATEKGIAAVEAFMADPTLGYERAMVDKHLSEWHIEKINE